MFLPYCIKFSGLWFSDFWTLIISRVLGFIFQSSVLDLSSIFTFVVSFMQSAFDNISNLFASAFWS